MNILGISCFYHDAAAALLVDGQLVAAAEEERFSRRKHDAEFPGLAIKFCLEQAGLTAADLDYVVFYEKPFVKFERILTTALQAVPRSWKVFGDAMTTWLLDKLWVKNVIRVELGVPNDKILFSEHHLSHAASTFLCSPFDEAAILTVDGVGEWACATFGRGRGTEVSLLREIRFPHSLGLLYSAFTAFLGFEVNEGEYKVMGMAPYGEPKYCRQGREALQDRAGRQLVARHGLLLLPPLDHADLQRQVHRAVRRAARSRTGCSSPSSRASRRTSATSRPTSQRIAERNQYYADIAASIQHCTEEIVLAMARALHRETGLEHLCLAGGVALNSVANGRILRETPFTDLFVQPAAGDGGGALGAALFAQHCVLGQPRSFRMEHAYWGQGFSDAQIGDFLREASIAHTRCANEDQLLDRVVDHLRRGHVVGWFQNRFEWGPRALGARSIIADPGRADMKDIVNTKIKFREPFRPFAPSVLVDAAERYFELDQPARHYPARFMLYVVDVKPGQGSVLPAITHVDNTARLQTVHRDQSPLYYRLIERFGQASGMPVILNTSFNLKGEPIVTTPAQAHSTFMRSGMDALVLGNSIIAKS